MDQSTALLPGSLALNTRRTTSLQVASSLSHGQVEHRVEHKVEMFDSMALRLYAGCKIEVRILNYALILFP